MSNFRVFLRTLNNKEKSFEIFVNSCDLILLVLEEYNYQNIYKAILKSSYIRFFGLLFIYVKRQSIF